MDIKRNKPILNDLKKDPSDPVLRFARLKKNNALSQEKKQDNKIKKTNDVKKVFLNKNIIFLLFFVILICFFVWMWIAFFKSSGEADFKKDFETNFLPSNTAPSSQAQASSAAAQASKTVSQNQSASTATKNQVAESTENSSNEEEKVENKKYESATLGFNLEYAEGINIAESGDIVTITKDSIAWKIKFYNNKNKKDFQAWYTDHFEIEDSSKCTFTDAVVKVGSLESKLVKASSDAVKCDGDGNYAINTDKSKVVKIELGKETVENVNKILTNFKFIN